MEINRQIDICKMIRGDAEVIKKCLFSASKYARIDAIRWATYHHMESSDIVARIVELKNDDSVFFGYTVSNFAIAALEKMGIEKYEGDDEYQKDLIESFIPTKEDVIKILQMNSGFE